ncbi:MAG TPA: hypothetical protein VKT73_13690 [Xanthobacteraceae bacterium]|nr:hypothetical protein [Xanthobacteraceae bacterium]
MRLIGTAIAIAAALTLATVGAADAKRGAKTYKFCVQCPVLSPVAWTKGTCSAKGKTIEEARTSCHTQNLGCYIRNYSAKTCK